MKVTDTMQNILVIGAHFDDAELGCGGVMARFAQEGKKVYKLTLTDNRTDFQQRQIRVGFQESVSDSAKACAVLGVTEITDFAFTPCNQLSYGTEQMQKMPIIDGRYAQWNIIISLQHHH